MKTVKKSGVAKKVSKKTSSKKSAVQKAKSQWHVSVVFACGKEVNVMFPRQESYEQFVSNLKMQTPGMTLVDDKTYMDFTQVIYFFDIGEKELAAPQA